MPFFRNRFYSYLNSFLLICILLLPINSHAGEEGGGPSLGAMVGDLVFARPLLFAVTAVGTALYVVTLPATLLTGNAGEAGEVLVLTPAEATFTRCLGCTNKNSYEGLYDDDELSFKSYDYENEIEKDPLGIYIYAGANNSLAFGVDKSHGNQVGLGYRLVDSTWIFLDLEAAYHSTGIVEDAKTGGNDYPTFNYDLTYKTDSILLAPRFGLKLGSYVTTFLSMAEIIGVWTLKGMQGPPMIYQDQALSIVSVLDYTQRKA